ncbi:MAG: helicase-related protein, partial [Gammaproteobacteria bacterium]|nr:helicase-related protein [Gammaproteobacteria bacterium]
LIGTHQLLSDRLKIKNLGLLVIDEEHRFGVKQKEKIKELSLTVDLLTLTATPIPRTLNMALENLRQMSVIATPPAKRLSIKTFCTDYNESLVCDAINRELDRGGQVYFLHNQVRDIQETAEHLQKLVPRARIGIAHGEMRKAELESVMTQFYHRECNLLVCTTIIESGLDVPNANTIIIDRADRLGLAQLHQIRGRVGRAQKQAYAYLLTPQEMPLTKNAEKRLEAIQNADELGAGFTLAMHDLEIRGAGELLGSEQSGVIEGIGYTLYLDMLNETIEALQAGKVPQLDKKLESGVGIDFHVPALIPAVYVPDVGLRLIFYKRISAAKDNLELDRLMVECIDRFGRLPGELQNLFRITRIKLKAVSLGFGTIKFSMSGGHIELLDYEKFDATKLIQMVQRNSSSFRFKGQSRLEVTADTQNSSEMFSFIENLLQDLDPTVAQEAA